MLFRFALRCGVIWSLYLQQVDVFLGFAAFDVIAKLISKIFCSDRSWASVTKKLSYVLSGGAFIWLLTQFDANSTWFFYIVDGPHYMLYTASGLYIVCAFTKILSSARRCQGVRFAVYRIRKFIYNTYIAVSFCITLYYATSVIELLQDKSNSKGVTLLQTTAVTNHTITACETLDRQDEALENLYDTTKFTLDCAYDIWRRNRINILAWLQIKILFGLTWRLTHYKDKLKRKSVNFNCQLVDENALLMMTLSQIVKYTVLFFAITLWFDNIVEWYVMPISTACMLTIFAYIEEIYERRLFRSEPRVYNWFFVTRTKTNTM